jgi:hypothetical protein
VDLCTLPPHAFIIMTVYFLQKLNPPVVPVLHETIASSSSKRASSTSSSKKPSTSQQADQDYEHDTIQNFHIFKKNLGNFIAAKSWHSSNTDSLGALWLKMLTFYSIDFGFKKLFVSIRSIKPISKSKVKMYSKKLAIEDPFSLKQSLSRNLLTETNKFIIGAISKCCIYFVNKTDSTSNSNSRIVDDLIAETGINDAKKSNRQMDDGMDSDDEELDEEEEDQEEDDEEGALENGDFEEESESELDTENERYDSLNLIENTRLGYDSF